MKRCSRLSNFLPYIPKRNYHRDRFELLQCSLDQSCIRWTSADFLVEKEVVTKRQDDMADMGVCKNLHQKGSNLLKVLKSVLVRRIWIHIVIFC